MTRLANTNTHNPFGFLFLAVTQSPSLLSSWQKEGGGAMDDLCVRGILLLGEIRGGSLLFPSWEGLGVGFLFNCQLTIKFPLPDHA